MASADDAPTAKPSLYLAERAGVRFAGTHWLIEIVEGKRLDDAAHVERAIREAVDAIGSTLLHLHCHRFDDQGGVTAVASLSESHMSIHTWPEVAYAAADVFLCGDKQPHAAVEVLRKHFEPSRVEVVEHHRGRGCF